MKKLIRKILFCLAIVVSGNLISQTTICDSLYYKNKSGSWMEKPHKYTGDCMCYYPNGNKSCEFHYENGQLVGAQKWFHETGQLKMECTYVYVAGIGSMGDGPLLEYFENGKIKLKLNYKDNMLEGKWLENNSTGKTLKSGVYKKGKLISGNAYSAPLK